jgi:hypothetical protein
MARKRHDEEMVVCPVGRFFMDIEKASARKSKFFEHFDRSRVEFLKALRSLLDESIERVEKKEHSGREKKATRIEVEGE